MTTGDRLTPLPKDSPIATAKPLSASYSADLVNRPVRLPQGKVVLHAPHDPAVFRVAQAFTRFVLTSFFDLKAYHADRVPRTGGVLIVSNHQSMLDPVILGTPLGRALSYLAKSELFENPVFGGLIRRLGAFPIRQTGSAAGAIKETIDRLQEGRALNIFPEGSRSTDGELLPMEKGAALVIRKAKVPVVPAAVYGSFEAFPPGLSVPKPHPVRVIYGEPIILHDKPADEIMRRIGEEIGSLYTFLQASEPMAAKRRAWAIQRRRSLLAAKGREDGPAKRRARA